MKRVLFICTKNSARSQMAEGLVNYDLNGKVQAFSAGVEPSFVHPTAIAVMRELGIDISQQKSKGLDEFVGQPLDYVITLCDQAAESCPVFFGGAQKLHMGFLDPASVSGDEAEKVAAFRKVRDQIRDQVIVFLKSTLE